MDFELFIAAMVFIVPMCSRPDRTTSYVPHTDPSTDSVPLSP